MLDPNSSPTPRSHSAAPLLLAMGVLFAGLAGCGNGTSPTATTSIAGTTAPLATTAATSGTGGAGTATLCRHLQNLKSLDYAFGAPFSTIQALDPEGKALTLQHLQEFLAEAPPELQQAVTDLVAVWVALGADPSSVTESDPRLTSATQTLTNWLASNCG